MGCPWPLVVALFAVLARFALAVDGFRAGDLQPQMADYQGQPYSMSQMAYDLRRLRLNGHTERRPGTHRYRLSAEGRRMAPLLVYPVYVRVSSFVHHTHGH